MSVMTDFFQTWAFFINQWDIQNTKFWYCNHLWCAIHDQNRAKKWSDFDKNWYTYRPNFWLLPRKILLKSDHFEANYHRSKLSDFNKILRGSSQKFGLYVYQFLSKSDYFLALFWSWIAHQRWLQSQNLVFWISHWLMKKA